MMEKTKQKNGLTWFRIVLVSVGLVFSYFFVSQTFELWAIQKQCQIEQTKLQESLGLQQNLALERERLYTKEYIEKIAREELGLVKSGEVPYMSTHQPR